MLEGAANQVMLEGAANQVMLEGALVRDFITESDLTSRIRALENLGIPGVPYRGGWSGEVTYDLQQAASEQNASFYNSLLARKAAEVEVFEVQGQLQLALVEKAEAEPASIIAQFDWEEDMHYAAYEVIGESVVGRDDFYSMYPLSHFLTPAEVIPKLADLLNEVIYQGADAPIYLDLIDKLCSSGGFF
jgi:hypothetical protein